MKMTVFGYLVKIVCPTAVLVHFALISKAGSIGILYFC